MTVPAATIRDRLRMIEQRFYGIAKQAEENGGLLKRHEVWRKDYLSFRT